MSSTVRPLAAFFVVATIFAWLCMALYGLVFGRSRVLRVFVVSRVWQRCVALARVRCRVDSFGWARRARLAAFFARV